MLDIERTLLHESRKFYVDGDIGGLINVAEIHRGMTDDFAFYNNLLWRLFGAIWNLPDGAPGVAQVMEILAESYHDFIFRLRSAIFAQIDVGAIRSRIPYRKAPRRPAFLINTFQPTTSSSSDALLTYSRHLVATADHDPCLVNVHYHPKTTSAPRLFTNLDFLPIMVEPGWHMHGLPGQTRIPVYVTGSGPGLSGEKIVEILRVLVERQADVVVGHGTFNIIADLVAPLWPAVCLESTRSEAVSFAHVFLSLGDKVTYFQRNRADLYPAERAVLRLSAAFPIEARRHVYDRAGLGFAADDYVVALVGYRLNVEIDRNFVDFVIAALAAVPRLRFVLAGVHKVEFLDRLPADLAARCTARGVDPDIRDLLALCDCYVNTPRLGGGGSALVALAEAKPVLSLPGGDVGGILGPENCVSDLAAMAARLVELATDPAAQASAEAKAATIYAQYDFADNIALVEQAFRAARRIFDETDALR